MKTSSLKPIAARHAHDGFTLVELLLVIAIIAVLSTMAVSVLGSAQDDARAAATQARIRIVERILQAELEDYEVRRLPFLPAVARLTQTLIASGQWSNRRDPGVPFDAVSNPSIFNVHFRNLKRMFVADLIRAEMPNGRQDIPATLPIRPPGISPPRPTVPFPSDNLVTYLVNDLGVSPIDPDLSAIRQFEFSGAIFRWSGWNFDPSVPNTNDNVNARSREQRVADASEMLYHLLSQIDFNGTSALDALGGNAVGDSDGDGQLEIVDGWGGPIAFQFHQENLQRVTPAAPSNGVWGVLAGTSQFTELEVETRDDEADLVMAMTNGVKPVRVDQIRPFLSSEKLFEIEQSPVDFTTLQPEATP